MKAILYRDLTALKSQKKNFLLSILFMIIFPLVIKNNNISFISTNILFLFVSSLIPATIGLQFSNYLLLQDKKSDIFPLLFRSGLSIPEFYFIKIIVPTIIAILFNILSFASYMLFFNDLIDVFETKDLVYLFLISLLVTILILLISETFVFIIKDDVYYPTVCVIISIAIIGLIFYFVKPFEHIFIFTLVFILISFINYYGLKALLKNNYACFGGK